MTSFYQIPLQVGTPQSLTITLSGVEYQITFIYRNIDQGGWFLDIDDTAGNELVHGIPLVTGVNLLAQYKHLGFGGGLYVQTTSDPDAVPTFDNLGGDAVVYWVTSP